MRTGCSIPCQKRSIKGAAYGSVKRILPIPAGNGEQDGKISAPKKSVRWCSSVFQSVSLWKLSSFSPCEYLYGCPYGVPAKTIG